jgi:hypothetical protein
MSQTDSGRLSMNQRGPDRPQKPHSIWPGVVILSVLLALVAWAVLSGEMDPWNVLAFLVILAVIAAAAVLSALIAARVRDAARVVVITRLLCPLFVALVGVSGYAAAAWWGMMRASAPGFWCVLGIFTLVGGTLAPFVSAHAVYRHARRSGKTHEEAQALSRWDPDKYGLK